SEPHRRLHKNLYTLGIRSRPTTATSTSPMYQEISIRNATRSGDPDPLGKHTLRKQKKRAEARFFRYLAMSRPAYAAGAPSPSSTAFIDRRMRPCLSTSRTLTLT